MEVVQGNLFMVVHMNVGWKAWDEHVEIKNSCPGKPQQKCA